MKILLVHCSCSTSFLKRSIWNVTESWYAEFFKQLLYIFFPISQCRKCSLFYLSSIIFLLTANPCEGCLVQQETDFCKNLLQEYAQNMNYAIPFVSGLKRWSIRESAFCMYCRYWRHLVRGGASKMKKREAEIKAARTAFSSSYPIKSIWVIRYTSWQSSVDCNPFQKNRNRAG